jgi:hypothetical protein
MKKSSTLERFYKPFLSNPIFVSKRQDYQENWEYIYSLFLIN